MEKMVFPGVGALYLNQDSAITSPGKNKLLAPKYRISFDEKSFDDKTLDDFIEYLAKKYNTGKKKAGEQFRKYSLLLLNNIANFGKAEIENLGTFKRKNGKVVFELSPLFEEIVKTGYTDLPLVYIDRNNEPDISSNNRLSSPGYTPVAVKKENSKKNDWIFPLLILIFMSLIFICLVNCLTGVFAGENASASASNNGISENYKSSTGDSDVADDKKQSSVASFVPDDTVENEGEVFSDTSDDNPHEASDSSAGVVAGSRQGGSPLAGKNMEKIHLEELIKMAPELQKAYNKSCIIITGSFVKKRNAQRMIELLAKKGYTPYSEKYGRFHRTGVVFDCEKNSLYDFLRTLREDIDEKSWVLKWK